MTLPAAMVLSGIPREHFGDELCNIFDQGTVLLKSPSSSSTSSFKSAESGFSSLSSIDSMENKLDYYLAVIDKLEERFKLFSQLPKPKPILSESTTSTPPEAVEVNYDNRNLLDLASNIAPSGWNYRPATIKTGVEHFFENRSQLSRIDGAQMPRHIMVKCSDKQCGFYEPIFY